MREKNPVPIALPENVAQMSPKQIVVLMRSLGVGKENYAPPDHARPWSATEFLTECTRRDVMRNAKKFPPERTTVDGWFSPNGPLPDDRRDAWHYFFHVFFSYERRAFGTLEWKDAYFEAVRREKVKAAQLRDTPQGAELPLERPKNATLIDIKPLLKGRS